MTRESPTEYLPHHNVCVLSDLARYYCPSLPHGAIPMERAGKEVVDLCSRTQATSLISISITNIHTVQTNKSTLCRCSRLPTVLPGPIQPPLTHPAHLAPPPGHPYLHHHRYPHHYQYQGPHLIQDNLRDETMLEIEVGYCGGNF